jgi:hypothetical protein
MVSIEFNFSDWKQLEAPVPLAWKSTVQSTTRSTTRNPSKRIPLGRRSSTTSRRRIWIVYDKSKEHLDGLRQVGGEFGLPTASRRRIWIIYFNSEKDQPASTEWFHPRQLLGLHQQRHTFIKRLPWPDGASILVGQARASEGHESSKLPGSAHPFGVSILVGRARASEGLSPPNYPAQPTPFLRLHPSRASLGIGRA